MKYFRRVLQYVVPQYKAVLVSVFCAVIVAVLFTLSIAAMLPLMKIMIGEEGPHGWVNREIIECRFGITFEAVDLPETLAAIADPCQPTRPLRVTDVKKDSPAEQKGLQKSDEILSAGKESSPAKQISRDKLLEQLAWAPAEQAIMLTVKHYGESQKIIAIIPAARPIYASTAKWLLSFMPRSQSETFKRNCVILIIIMILIATLVRCLMRFTQEYLVRKISFRSIMLLRQDAYNKTIHLPLSFFSAEGISDTTSRFVQDSLRIYTGITTLFGKVVREPFKMVVLTITAYMINAEMTIIVLLGAPAAAFVIGKLGKKMKRATKRTLGSWSLMLGHLQETLSGIRVVKGYHREAHEEKKFALINEKLLKQQNRMAKVDSAGGPLLESLGITAACVGMIFAAYWMTKGEIKTTEFFIVVMLLGLMAESGRKLGDVIPRLQASDASAERVYKLIDAPIEVDPDNALELPRLGKSLEMRNVNFQYPNSPTPTLEDISLTIKAGETVAVVGPNGSGKTTLTSLISRFFIPQSGEILIDGTNITEASLSSLRGQIGIVTQHTVSFNDTISANIAYGDLDATEEEIIEAAKKAYAHEFITQTAQGYQTIVGEQGATLSGGQLQRIAIARAILRNPAVLIFDEAMSQIDADSEAKIQKALAEFTRGRTSFIIAHRLSTIIDADRILVLDCGKLIAQGKHQELLKTCNLYRQLYEVQFVGSEE
ncbi:MAG: ATP-binding cassette domain-containing protein [Sedimentisphaerales bacterium]|nr:ATP-binding cassette domain-containing protein [Sedimentisphaerales bacterium]